MFNRNANAYYCILPDDKSALFKKTYFSDKSVLFSITMKPWSVRWRLKLPASRLFAQPLFAQAQIKENNKASRHWPLWGVSTGDRWIPLTEDQWRGKWFHLMTSSWISDTLVFNVWHTDKKQYLLS